MALDEGAAPQGAALFSWVELGCSPYYISNTVFEWKGMKAMRFDKILKGLAALAATAMVTGCNVSMNVGDFDGVPLAELDMSGEAPTSVALGGPDTLIVTKGEAFTIEVEGDEEARDLLRFNLDDDTLSVGRANNSGSTNGTATVRVTMPSLKAIALGGSGVVEADELSGQTDIAVGGSGKVRVANVSADTLDLAIGGSGSVEASGTSRTLDLAIGGSGSAKMRGLKVDTADIAIGGSGNAQFSSDGTVDASIAGSGDVTVYGNATCTVSAFGSGTLRCEKGETEEAAAD